MSWEKIGLIFKADMAQLPVVSRWDDHFVVAFSRRAGQNKSIGMVAPFCVDEGKFKFSKASTLISAGKVGSCDVAGVMPMQLIDDKLYYIGWTLRKDVPYFNYTSIAVLNENRKIIKRGPILAPDLIDPGYSGTFFFTRYELGGFIGYYLSTTDWIEDENNELQPSYDLKIAISDDRLSWKKVGKVAIALEEGEAGIASATIVKVDNIYHMWFCCRAGRHFRTKTGCSYRIRHAYSLNQLDWIRTSDFSLDPSGSENMAAYPSVFVNEGWLYLFYNGTSFGRGGVSAAKLPIETIKKYNQRL